MVRDLALNFPKIDTLINNAGVFLQQKNILKNGLEETLWLTIWQPSFLP